MESTYRIQDDGAGNISFYFNEKKVGEGLLHYDKESCIITGFKPNLPKQQGHGTKFYNLIEKEAIKRGCKYIGAEDCDPPSEDNNPEAFWKAMGMKENPDKYKYEGEAIYKAFIKKL